MNLLRLPFKLTDTVLTHPLTSHKSAYRHRLYKRYFSHVNLTYQKLNKLYLNKLNKLNWPANTFLSCGALSRNVKVLSKILVSKNVILENAI